MPSVSIILTSYNQKQLLINAVESVLNQKRLPDSLIICDDGSIDGSREVLVDYKNQFPDLIQLNVSKSNLGVSANRNIGAGLSNDDYLIFLDGDDQLLPNKIESDLTVLKKCDRYDDVIVWSNFLFGKSLEESERWLDKPYSHLTITTKHIAGRKLPKNKLFRNELIPRKLFEQVGGFDERYSLYEDWDLKVRLSDRARYLYNDTVGSFYRLSNTGLSNREYVEHLNMFYKIASKNSALFTSEVFAELRSSFKFLLGKVAETNGRLSSPYISQKLYYEWFKLIHS